MRKVDPEVNENIDRNANKENAAAQGKTENSNDQTIGSGQLTEVKNASASGLGTMGRSDEKLSDQSGETSGNAY